LRNNKTWKNPENILDNWADFADEWGDFIGGKLKVKWGNGEERLGD